MAMTTAGTSKRIGALEREITLMFGRFPNCGLYLPPCRYCAVFFDNRQAEAQFPRPTYRAALRQNSSPELLSISLSEFASYLLDRTKSTEEALFPFTVTDFSQVFGWVKIGRCTLRSVSTSYEFSLPASPQPSCHATI